MSFGEPAKVLFRTHLNEGKLTNLVQHLRMCLLTNNLAVHRLAIKQSVIINGAGLLSVCIVDVDDFGTTRPCDLGALERSDVTKELRNILFSG